ncbi:YdcH family protein [Alteriqipengyuania sp. WL0013]|nr:MULTISPECIES: YdcH family protein [Alteriqipengyuania]MEB3416736.1 YdcH family protein [Alteriqipengyuania sp. WL0013]WJY17568.1 YdcH family protein [Alteriqipengyuania flavescens]WJY23511.1 YdcH family protein [Alteriqipengyuania flavescens]
MSSSHVAALETKHARLEQMIASEMARPAPDDATISGLKKQKLAIKEELAHI